MGLLSTSNGPKLSGLLLLDSLKVKGHTMPGHSFILLWRILSLQDKEGMTGQTFTNPFSVHLFICTEWVSEGPHGAPLNTVSCINKELPHYHIHYIHFLSCSRKGNTPLDVYGNEGALY